MAPDQNRCLHQVFAGLAFPAHRWMIIAYADNWGIDTMTRERLQALPPALYRSLEHVIRQLRAAAPGLQPNRLVPAPVATRSKFVVRRPQRSRTPFLGHIPEPAAAPRP